LIVSRLDSHKGIAVSSVRASFGLFTLSAIFILFLCVLIAPPDGAERGQLLQFVGHFHPLSVHLPIALLIVVPLLEIAGRTRHFPALLPAADFILGLALCGAIASVTLGWCLARSGGYSGALVRQHMWGGLLVAATAWLCWTLRARRSESRLDPAYGAALIGAVILVSFTGYRGGQLSQGENHLTEHMPAPLRSLFGLPATHIALASGKIDVTTFYGARIQPLLSGHCISCHGPSKHKGDLRLDSYAAIMRGGKDGAIVRAGAPGSSELVRRVTLPSTSDDFMPANKKAPLSPDEVKLIEYWIASGATATQPADAAKNIPGSPALTPKVAEIPFEEVDPVAVEKERAGLAGTVEQLQRRWPEILTYESRSSANLAINASLLGSRFGDEDIVALMPIAERIVTADFSGTAITDRSANILGNMKHLMSLRLAHTKITDATVAKLTSLTELVSLNLFDTQITPSALASMEQLSRLRRVYVGGTGISQEAATAAQLKDKLIF